MLRRSIFIATVLPGVSISGCVDEQLNPVPVDGGGSQGASIARGGAGGVGASLGGGGRGGAGAAGGGGTPLPAHNHNCESPKGELPPLKLTRVVDGFPTRPVLVRSPPGDPNRLFVLDQDGQIFVWQQELGRLTEFLDIREKVGNDLGSEPGFIGFTFHPDYQTNGRFFVHYSAAVTADTVIAEYRVSSDPDVADPAPVLEPLLFVDQPLGNHNGGMIEFSPVDGMLYIGLGDGGPGQDPDDRGQDINILLAKILRIDVDSGSPYAIPRGNLPGGQPEIWDYGLRNPWRFSFDACTGDLYIGDVGQNAVEEIDYEPAGTGHHNYGWRLMEADQCYIPATDCNPTGELRLPIVSVPHVAGCNAIVGGYVYRGHAIAALRGAYLYADTCQRYVRGLRVVNGVPTEPFDLTEDLMPPSSIWSFGQDYNGELYLLSGDAVYRIEPE